MLIIKKLLICLLLGGYLNAYCADYNSCKIMGIEIDNQTNYTWVISDSVFENGYLVSNDLIQLIDKMAKIQPSQQVVFYAHDQHGQGPSITLTYEAKENPKLKFIAHFSKINCDSENVKSISDLQVTSNVRSIVQQGTYKVIYSYQLVNTEGFYFANDKEKNSLSKLTLVQCHMSDDCNNFTKYIKAQEILNGE